MKIILTVLFYVISNNALAETDIASISSERQTEILYLLKHDCGSCHGMTLQGGLGSPLTPQALQNQTIEQIATTIAEGRQGTPMPPWQIFFTPPEIQWLAQQLKQGIANENPQ